MVSSAFCSANLNLTFFFLFGPLHSVLRGENSLVLLFWQHVVIVTKTIRLQTEHPDDDRRK